jgi:DNA-binding transcriptional regulator YhcF (GntR family)
MKLYEKDIKMQSSLKKNKSKSQNLVDVISKDINSGKLAPGSRIESVRGLAKRFNVSIATVQYAFEELEKRNLIERRAGSGTFVKEQQVTPVQNSIKILTPLPDVSTLHPFPKAIFREITDGILPEATARKSKVELVPISTSNSFGDIEWDFLKDLNESDKLVINGSWYRTLFPFLLERKCQVAYFDFSYLDDDDQTMTKNWLRLSFSIESAFEQIVEHLKFNGYSRVAVCKRYNGDEKNDTTKYSFFQAHKKAIKKYNLEYDEELYNPLKLAMPAIPGGEVLRQHIIKLYRSSKFDALMMYGLADINTVLNTLKYDLKLRIPEDVAVVSWGDYPELLSYNPAITALKFPIFDMAREGAKLLLEMKENEPCEVRFNTEVITRASSNRANVQLDLVEDFSNMHDMHVF